MPRRLSRASALPAGVSRTPRPMRWKSSTLYWPFEQSDLGCDAWLAEVEPLRGAGKAAFDCNREKRASLRRGHKFFQCFYRIFFICLIP